MQTWGGGSLQPSQEHLLLALHQAGVREGRKSSKMHGCVECEVWGQGAALVEGLKLFIWNHGVKDT